MADPGKLVGGKFGGQGRYTLIIDTSQAGVESNYYWFVHFIQNAGAFGLGYSGDAGYIEKVKDVYTSGETSAYWGSVEQRRAAQIDKFQQLMANVGNMVKTLFQLLRELRIMDERLEYYERAYKNEDAAEVALKSIWVDMVEGGIKNPGSVTGLAANVGFVTLPDLFYSIHPKKIEDVEREVRKLENAFNRKVREVLGRKLKQYIIWREKTYKELKVGKDFKVKYLRQHYYVIKIYLNWLRPYLRNIKRLETKGSAAEPEVVAAFDTSKIELELLAIRKEYETQDMHNNVYTLQFKKYFPCIRVRWNFVAIPQLAYQEEFQRGAIHRGYSKIIIEGFVATKEQLQQYKKALDEEDFELLSSVDEAIVSMKDEIEKYLTEAGEKKQGKEEKKTGLFDPFVGIMKGFKEVLHLPSMNADDKPHPTERSKAEGLAKAHSYALYKIYKQSHGMLYE